MTMVKRPSKPSPLPEKRLRFDWGDRPDSDWDVLADNAEQHYLQLHLNEAERDVFFWVNERLNNEPDKLEAEGPWGEYWQGRPPDEEVTDSARREFQQLLSNNLKMPPTWEVIVRLIKRLEAMKPERDPGRPKPPPSNMAKAEYDVPRIRALLDERYGPRPENRDLAIKFAALRWEIGKFDKEGRLLEKPKGTSPEEALRNYMGRGPKKPGTPPRD